MRTLSYPTISKIKVGCPPCFSHFWSPRSAKYGLYWSQMTFPDVIRYAPSESGRIILIRLSIEGEKSDYLPPVLCTILGHNLHATESVLKNLQTKRFFYGR